MNEHDHPTVEILRLRPHHVDGLLSLLEAIEQRKESAWFHPHPFTREHLQRIADINEVDLYTVVLLNGKVVGYGMLRGWREGYLIPSLGIAIHPDYRSRGISSMLIEFLHGVAQLWDSKSVRLRVNPANVKAIALYQRSGYLFELAEGVAPNCNLTGVRTFDR